MISASHGQALASIAQEGVSIALLEDDPLVAEVIGMALDQVGWDYRLYTTVADISADLRTRTFDLLVLDWMLPDGEADSVIRLVRQQLKLSTPILIESVEDDEQRIVDALAMGADDYVVKPLRLSEVQARIAALLRRSRKQAPKPQRQGAYCIDAANRSITLDGEAVPLSVTEFSLADYFFAHPNELLSRERLLSEVWARSPEIDTRTVDVHVCQLRKKLRLGPENGLQITTLRGYGYRLEANDD